MEHQKGKNPHPFHTPLRITLTLSCLICLTTTGHPSWVVDLCYTFFCSSLYHPLTISFWIPDVKFPEISFCFSGVKSELLTCTLPSWFLTLSRYSHQQNSPVQKYSLLCCWCRRHRYIILTTDGLLRNIGWFEGCRGTSEEGERDRLKGGKGW